MTPRKPLDAGFVTAGRESRVTLGKFGVKPGQMFGVRRVGRDLVLTPAEVHVGEYVSGDEHSDE